MIRLLITALLFGSFQLARGYEHEKILKSEKIVAKINGLKSNTWMADTYGTFEINTKHFVRTRLGVRMTRQPPSVPQGSSIEALEKANIPQAPRFVGDDVTLPVNFTWVDKKLTDCPIGNIRDQSNCGSCWAVSSTSAFSDRLCIKSKGKFKMPLSANHVTACDDRNYGCSGGYMEYVYNFFKTNGTITGGEYASDEGCQPYSIKPCSRNGATEWYCPFANARNPKCRRERCTNDWYPNKFEKKTYKISEFHYTDELSTRKEIYQNGPVTAGFWVYLDFMFYKKGIYEHKLGLQPLGGHAVRVVGWGEENGVKYWIVANSWGSDWGESGFFRIKRGVNMCTFEEEIIAVIPIWNNND